MSIIIRFPEAEFHLLCQPRHCGIFNDTEDLVRRGIKAERIAILREYLPDAVCGLNGGQTNFFIQMIRKQHVELEPEQPPFGEQRAVLLDDREKVRDRFGVRNDHGFAKQGAAFCSADLKYIA